MLFRLERRPALVRLKPLPHDRFAEMLRIRCNDARRLLPGQVAHQTRGKFELEIKGLAEIRQVPLLHLHVTAQSKESLEMAIAEIEQRMQIELPELIDRRRLRGRDPPPEQFQRVGLFSLE